ncbi:MAG: hypothetical protein AAGF11_36840 [Myxococcota bacterium]
MTFHSSWHRFVGRLTIAGLLVGLGATPVGAAASQTTAELEDVPTRLVVPSDPVAYPDPVCLGCKIATKRPAAGSGSDDTTAVLTVTYEDQAIPTFVGDIVLTVLLADLDEVREVPIDDVLLTDGQTAQFVVTADLDWTWADVEWVLVEMDEIGSL